MKKFLSIMINELRFFLTDKGAMLIMFLGVLAYSVCYAIPYHHEIVNNIPIGVIDLDQTKLSKTFIRNVHATDTLEIEGQYSSIQDTEQDMYKNKIMGFIIIPKDFEKDILNGKQVSILTYGDSAYLIIYKYFYSTITQVALELGAKIEINKLMKSGIPKQRAINISQPFEFVQIPLFNPVGGYNSYVYPIILILILHQTFIIGLGLMQGYRNEKCKKYCLEKENIPITILAKSTTYIVLYSIYAILFLLIYPQIFIYTIHYNFLATSIIFLLMMFSAAFFAQTISYWFRTRETVILLMISFSLVLIFLLGMIWPRESIPDILNWISLFIPVTCGVDAIIKINQNGATFTNVIFDYFWLIFLNIFYYITAILLTKKSDEEFEKKGIAQDPEF